MRYIFLCLFILSNFHGFSQEYRFPDFGSPTIEEIKMKDCSFDPGAGAVYLRKDAITIPDNQQMIVYFRYRIKILKASASDLANIKIRAYTNFDWEKIEDIKAVSINYLEDGTKKITELERGNIYKTKDDDYYSNITFSMPEVKEGTIIEYSYSSYRKSYKLIDYWYFQDEIPVLKSTYNYTILPGAEFSYRILKSRAHSIRMKEYKNEGRLFFEMSNMAGVKDEPYMDSKRDYLSRLELQMNYSGGSGLDKERFVGTWPELTQKLLRDEDFGLQLEHSISGTSELVNSAKSIDDENKRIAYLYYEVTRHMNWDNYIGIYAKDKLKFAWEKRRGTATEINLILIKLLRESGIPAYPLLASDRFHGKVDVSHPFISQFSKVIAYIETGSNKYFLDATIHGNVVNLIPVTLLNTTGYLVDRKNSRFITIADPMHYDKNFVNIVGTISPSGLLKGQAFIMDKDYSRLEKETQLRTDSNQFIYANYVKPFDKMRINSVNIDNLNNDTLSLNLMLNFTHQLVESGSYIMLQENLFSGFEQNPFVADERHTEINFGRNKIISINCVFDISEDIVLEALPKDIKLIMPDTSIAITRTTIHSPDNKRIISKLRLEMNRSHFAVDEYPTLKSFYKKLYDIMDEPIVLVAKNK